MIQPEPKNEPRQNVKTGPYSDIQERKPHEAPKVHVQKDEPIHEKGCAICDSTPGVVGDHTHTNKERSTLAQSYYATEIKEDERGPVETLGDQASTYAEKRERARMEHVHHGKKNDAEKKINIEDLLVEIHVMYKELMALQRRKFQLKQKLFAFQFAPDTLNEGSAFDLESIAIHRLQLLQKEIRKG